ncbi:hypothetical protein EDD96_2464 [Streptomyces sp. Ag109_G2-6]|uniref:hypothetical protein n=1 Tax=Streptomyces TaxID=1883 RepID=UPI0009A54F8A|nr:MULTISPECIES: hypothetical protein [Streptomyces]RPF45898.1 hypothetical protein EDD96_2464 [Streptomyces sp. Ag109_G2-6]
MALKWQGWVVGLVGLAGLLVFAPLGLYVWASSPSRPADATAAPPQVRVTDCRIDPASRRVMASVEARGGQGAYLVTVEFRDREPSASASASAGDAGARVSQSLVRLPGLAPDTPPARTEAVGPVWPPSTAPWCGVAGVAREGEGRG